MDEIAEVFEDLDDPRTGNAKRHLLRAGWDNAFLASMLSQFTKVQMR